MYKQPDTCEIIRSLIIIQRYLTFHKDPTHMDLQRQTEKLHQYLLSSDQVRALLVCTWKEARLHAQVYKDQEFWQYGSE